MLDGAEDLLVALDVLQDSTASDEARVWAWVVYTLCGGGRTWAHPGIETSSTQSAHGSK